MLLVVIDMVSDEYIRELNDILSEGNQQILLCF